jgi:hypothetical protein
MIPAVQRARESRLWDIINRARDHILEIEKKNRKLEARVQADAQRMGELEQALDAAKAREACLRSQLKGEREAASHSVKLVQETVSEQKEQIEINL